MTPKILNGIGIRIGQEIKKGSVIDKISNNIHCIKKA